MPDSNPAAHWLTAAQVAAFAVGAGFKGESLRTAVAISFAENPSHDPARLGDTTITDAKWGPSVGLWQIRSLKEEFGKGTARDQRALDNPAFNARSAYRISGAANEFSAWTEYTNGGWKKQLAAADAAIKANGGKAGGTVGDPDVPKEDVTEQLGIPGAILAGINQFGQTLFKFGLNSGAVVVALVLISLGVLLLARDPIKRAVTGTAKVAGVVAPQGRVAKGAGKVGAAL